MKILVTLDRYEHYLNTLLTEFNQLAQTNPENPRWAQLAKQTLETLHPTEK